MKSIKEQYLNHFNKYIETSDVLTEGGDGLTYYELRQFLTIMLRQSGSSETKKVLDDILKTVSKLEIMRVPIPVIRKQKTISPIIFK